MIAAAITTNSPGADWMATMWSYKLLKPTGGVEADNWYMVTNADALPALDIRTAPLE